ncbi:unnamed protein product [Kuraishia capsulata CBS 1993]|uniref:Mitochondrial 15S rRNA processing factor CCM1 n=1 Tax=Kuraishia capsulata CBS 1993 TaxID=1382522 RepID=W6MNF2_9ASCO|nr:uncharacterized protein KUCA_T00002529001 [Kuraishia capsulata CBS 1993]CDK26557.1 unnamed protein product [Kuraishia capsulata CBS 1993]
MHRNIWCYGSGFLVRAGKCVPCSTAYRIHVRPRSTRRLADIPKPKDKTEKFRDFEEPITPGELMSLESLGKINNFYDKLGKLIEPDLGKSSIESEAEVNRNPELGLERDILEISAEISDDKVSAEERRALPQKQEVEQNPVDLAIDRLKERLSEKGLQVSEDAISVMKNKFKTMPKGVVLKLGGAFVYLRESREDWKGILTHMRENSDGFNGLSPEEVNSLFMRIPASQRSEILRQFEKMVDEAGIEKGVKLYNMYINSCADSHNLSRDTKHMWKLMDQMKASGIAPDMYTYGSLLKGLSKVNDLDSMEIVRMEMNAGGLSLNKEMYTTILQTCIKTKHYDKAIDIFDNMRLMAVSTQPDAKTYSAVILAHVLKRDIEKALDIYEEMSKGPFAIDPEPESLLLLARGCSRQSRYILKGWRFIFQYHQLQGDLNHNVIEVMMHLAARDGDVNFTRALYNSSFQGKFLGKKNGIVSNPGPRMLNLYFTACSTDKGEGHVPVSQIDAQIRTVRQRVIDMFEYRLQGDSSSKVPPPPFLPLKELHGPDQIVNECEAFLNYSFLLSKQFVRQEIIGSFLNVLLAREDSVKRFEDAYNRLTFFDNQGVSADSQGVEIVEEPIQAAVESKGQLDKTKSLTTAEIEARKLAVAIPRDVSLYSIGLKAARVFKDPEFAQKVWTERGLYRKTKKFANIPYKKRDAQDFEFARGMVSVFIECNQLKEALAIVLSSKQRFDWNWYYLKSLYMAAGQIGDSSVQRVVLELTGKNPNRVR